MTRSSALQAIKRGGAREIRLEHHEASPLEPAPLPLRRRPVAALYRLSGLRLLRLRCVGAELPVGGKLVERVEEDFAELAGF
eukprot:763825-Hanusia_phi.AAC.1